MVSAFSSLASAHRRQRSDSLHPRLASLKLQHFALPRGPPETSPQISPLIFQPELNPGDALMMFSGGYRGASANTTKDEEKLVYSTFTTRGFLRQEENQYLAYDRKGVLELPVGLRRFKGYTLCRPFMGWVGMDDPMKIIDPKAPSLGDLW